jgi:HEAT repeat protein
LREEGARALQFFKSDDNVAALKKLLQDPSFVTRVKQEGERLIETHRDYRVREAAFATLKSFGIEVPEPILTEPLPRKKCQGEWSAHDRLAARDASAKSQRQAVRPDSLRSEAQGTGSAPGPRLDT